MASSSQEEVPGPDNWWIDSEALPSICYLGKGLSGYIYETKWQGNKYARKDFPLGSKARNDVFEREAKCLFASALDHPNIVKCVGYNLGDCSCSLVQEYVDSDLQSTIQRRIEAERKKTPSASSSSVGFRVVDADEIKRELLRRMETRKTTGAGEGSSKTSGKGVVHSFNFPEAEDIIFQICDGINYLHEKEVAHGDLKPKNVLLHSEKSGKRKVKVADFSLNETKKRIKLVSKRKQHFEILTWKAPERFEGLLGALTEDSDDPFTDSDTDGSPCLEDFNVLAKADVYSLGLIWSHVLGGKLLYPELRLTELRKQRMRGFRPEMPSENCPDSVRELIHSCLHLQPSERPTFSVIYTLLKAALHPQPPLLIPGADKQRAVTELQAAMTSIEYEPGKYHIAVCGVSGSGKSSLINAFRGLRDKDEGAARVGDAAMTVEVRRYPDEQFVWYEIPDTTAAMSDGQYFQTQRLFVFDWIIVVQDMSERSAKIESHVIENCFRLRIPVLIVRSKADLHVDNMIRSETGSLPSLADDDQTFRKIKAKYVGATRSAFTKSKEIMGELFIKVDQYRPLVLTQAPTKSVKEEIVKKKFFNHDFIQAPTESVEKEIAKMKLMSQRVYIVSAPYIQMRVKKWTDRNSILMTDEFLLVEEMARRAKHSNARFTRGQTHPAPVRLWDFEYDLFKSAGHEGIGASTPVTMEMWGKCVFARKEFAFEQLVREIAVAMNVSHPNIVHYFGYSLGANEFRHSHLYMELLDGNLQMSLEEARRMRVQLLSFRSLLVVLLQIAEAMRHLHDRNFVHGDLKPSNILVSGQQHSKTELDLVKVAGFSCAQHVDSKSGATVEPFDYRIGTPHYTAPHYTAPEVLMCRRYRHLPPIRHPQKIDVYSFGVVAYQLITEDPQVYDHDFPGDTMEVPKGVMDGTLRPDHNLRLLPALDEDRSSLLPLVRACWDQNPDNRPSFGQICATLRNLSIKRECG